MRQARRSHNTTIAFRLARVFGVVTILFFIATWLIGVSVFVRSILGDLDSILALFFEGTWTPSVVRAAAQGLGISGSYPAWYWLAIETVIILTFCTGGLVLYWRKPDRYGTFLGVAQSGTLSIWVKGMWNNAR